MATTKSMPDNASAAPNTAATAPTRSRFTLWHFSLVLVVLGLLVSGYLSYVQLTATPMACLQGSIFSCDTVQNSAYAKLGGISIAYLGFFAYVVMGVLLVFEARVGFLQQYGLMLLFGVVLFAWMYSMYLVYLQFAVLQALCQWCLMHEIIVTILFVVTLLRVRKEFASPAGS
jgi:uncharacterized membrane protein